MSHLSLFSERVNIRDKRRCSEERIERQKNTADFVSRDCSVGLNTIELVLLIRFTAQNVNKNNNKTKQTRRSDLTYASFAF